MIPRRLLEAYGFPKIETCDKYSIRTSRADDVFLGSEEAAQAATNLVEAANDFDVEVRGRGEPEFATNFAIAYHELHEHALNDAHLFTRGGRMGMLVGVDQNGKDFKAGFYEPVGRRSWTEHLKRVQGSGTELSEGDLAFVKVYRVLSFFERLVGRDRS